MVRANRGAFSADTTAAFTGFGSRLICHAYSAAADPPAASTAFSP